MGIILTSWTSVAACAERGQATQYIPCKKSNCRGGLHNGGKYERGCWRNNVFLAFS